MHVKRTGRKEEQRAAQQWFTCSEALVIRWHRTPERFFSRAALQPRTETIKGQPTVILALFFHSGSAAAGVQISRLGSPIKQTGSDLAETGAAGIPVSWLLGVGVGSATLGFSV